MRNRERWHILVLPEDEADENIANGFILEPKLNESLIEVLPICHGWVKVVKQFEKELIPTMRMYSKRIIVLLIDFDNDPERFSLVKSKIPQELQERVFILGVNPEPETLRKSSGLNYESIGKNLASDCPKNRHELWSNDCLKHNEEELNRMDLFLKQLGNGNSILFN